MSQERFCHHIRVLESGSVEQLSEGTTPEPSSFPMQPGEYTRMPVDRVWSVGAEHSAWVPRFGWVPGVIPQEEWPELMELPDAGLDRT